jgi:hypothetical protein
VVLGALGDAIGSLWLGVTVRRSRARDPASLLTSTWSATARHRFLFSGRALYFNRFGHRWRDILLLRILRGLNRAGVRCAPILSARNFDVLRDRVDGGRPPIVVLAHAPADAAINRLFDEASIPWTLLAASPSGAIRKARLLGLAGELDVITRNSDALLSVRQRLAAGRLICACIDFTQPSEPGQVFVSPALFEVAKMTRSPIVYADVRVRDDGVVEVVFAAPRIALATSAGMTCAEDFIDWLRTERGDQRPLSVLRWTSPAAKKWKKWLRLYRRSGERSAAA